jgi:hypothetical protein
VAEQYEKRSNTRKGEKMKRLLIVLILCLSVLGCQTLNTKSPVSAEADKIQTAEKNMVPLGL